MKPMKTQKTTTKIVPYTLKKLMLIGGMITLPFTFGGCDKDPIEPNNEDNNKPKIARLIFDKNGHHIELDTIRYYLAQDFDSIYMIANPSDMFVTVDNLDNAVLYLKDRTNLSPKVRGNGLFVVNRYTSQNNRQDLSNMGFRVVIDDNIR